MNIEELETGDRILFSDRSVPLKVSETADDHVLVKGPNGGEYEIYRSEDSEKPLVCKPGNRRYSSYVEDLRKVGEWRREDDSWKHTDTGAEINITKNSAGFWTIEKQKIELETLDLPKYGFSDKEAVEKEVEKILRKHPEGK